MLDLMADVRSREIVEQSLEIIANLYLVLVFAPVLSFDEVPVDILHQEGLYE